MQGLRHARVQDIVFSEPVSNSHFCSGKQVAWNLKQLEKCQNITDRTEVWLKTWYEEVLEAFSLLKLIMWIVFEVTLSAVEILSEWKPRVLGLY